MRIHTKRESLWCFICNPLQTLKSVLIQTIFLFQLCFCKPIGTHKRIIFQWYWSLLFVSPLSFQAHRDQTQGIDYEILGYYAVKSLFYLVLEMTQMFLAKVQWRPYEKDRTHLLFKELWHWQEEQQNEYISKLHRNSVNKHNLKQVH